MTKNKKIYVLDVEERLDSNNIKQFKSESQEFIKRKGCGLIINFTNTKFIDSMGLGSLVSILKSTTQSNIKLTLCALTPQVKEIFELTRLYRLFEISENLDDAKASMA